MSNYQRNTSMIVCIFAVIVVGAIAVGLISYYGNTNWNWNPNPPTTDFAFEAEVGTINGTITLDVALETGAINVIFVDNASLLYDINMRVQNTTLEDDGAPVVTFLSNTIGLDYTAAAVNITLGSGVNYTLDIHTTTGGVALELTEGAHISDVTILVTTGAIDLGMTDDVILIGSPTFNLQTTTGSITIDVDLPSGIGGSVECAVTTGSIDISATGWIQITSNHYETTDYDTALQTITLVAETTIGSIDAIFT
ncbi:MAG: hypothetical protein ACFFCT_10470 [Candidatus Odinarchaeota archaeon]